MHESIVKLRDEYVHETGRPCTCSNGRLFTIRYTTWLEKRAAEHCGSVGDTAHNTGSPKLPTLEEVESSVAEVLRKADGYDDWQALAVREAYDFICRQLRAGA